MNRPSEKVLSYLAGNENIDTITIDDLQKLVAENPYFPVTQFLLAKKLKGENETQFASQVQKTSLYFSNPHWLQYQLSGSRIVEETGTFQQAEIDRSDKAHNNFSETESATISETAFPVEDKRNESSSINIQPNDTLPVHPDVDTAEATNTVESPGLQTAESQINIEETAEPPLLQAQEEMAAVARDTNAEAEDFINHLPAEIVIAEPASLPVDVPVAAETEVVELEEEMAGVTHDSGEATEEFLEDISEHENNNAQGVDDEHDKMFQNIKAMLDASTEEADADTKNAVVPIDPYYTIDYFASQGIKLELDQNPKDQLGQNLKKFTQWLKHMKKLGPEDATETINRTETEADIQQIADSSNTVREVVTEAMATVLEKQGKRDKAIELYNKLTFLNPDKSTYFAAKIQKLKGF